MPVPDCQQTDRQHFKDSLIKFDDEKFNKDIKSNVLVAGCGMGQQAVAYGSKVTKSSITGIDLSKTSLSYAQRKAAELNSTKISFIQGDILEIKKLGQNFDVILCSGVLHHMEDPDLGLSRLTDILSPGGMIKLGLYSETARPVIFDARFALDKYGFDRTKSNLRLMRNYLLSSAYPRFRELSKMSDMYSTSEFHDLI